jgi:hypothetical protein
MNLSSEWILKKIGCNINQNGVLYKQNIDNIKI